MTKIQNTEPPSGSNAKSKSGAITITQINADKLTLVSSFWNINHNLKKNSD